MSRPDVRRLALGTVLAGFEGLEPPDWLWRRLGEGLGGVVLFARNVHDDVQVADLAAAIHAEAPAAVAIDEEGGDVTRLDARSGSEFPGALVLGTAADLNLTQGVAAELGARLAAVGIDLDLAPVADLLLDPMSPIVGVRSFGSDPASVAAQVGAFVAGLQSQGVAACLKHFPGHGATAGDSHHVLPEVEGGAEGLEAALAPFAGGIAAAAQAVMTAHVRVPLLDDQPATLSRPIIKGLLRDRLGFGGVVITDGLDMGAISRVAGGQAAGPLALAAGVDALCLGGGPAAEADVERAVEAIMGAVESGALPMERLEVVAARVRGLAEWASRARDERPPAVPGAAMEAALRALRCAGRVEVAAPVTLIELVETPSEAAGPVPLALPMALRRAGLEVDHIAVSAGSPAPEPRSGGTPVVVVRDLHRHHWQQAIVSQIVTLRSDTIVVEVGVPLLELAGARGYIATFGASRASCEAAAAALAGRLVRP